MLTLHRIPTRKKFPLWIEAGEIITYDLMGDTSAALRLSLLRGAGCEDYSEALGQARAQAIPAADSSVWAMQPSTLKMSTQPASRYTTKPGVTPSTTSPHVLLSPPLKVRLSVSKMFGICSTDLGEMYLRGLETQ